MKQKIAMIIFFALMIAFGWFVAGPELNHALRGCHAVSAQEEEGNPGHKEPTQSCAHRPKPGQVGCKCMKHCDPEGRDEDRRCKSFCFPKWCTCPPCT
jgi:hypothetical protein